jgi:hypothetical protein
MRTRQEFFEHRIREAWSKIRVSPTKNSDLIDFHQQLLSVLPENIRIDTQNPMVHEYLHENGIGFKLRRDTSKELLCEFSRSMGISYLYNLERIPPANFAGFAVSFFSSLPEWCTIYEARRVLEVKRAKIRSIAEKNIALMLKSLMLKLDCQYFIESQQTRVILHIKMEGKRQLEIPISHKKFIDQLERVPETVQRFRELCNQSEFRIIITNYGNNITWKEGENDAS